jgi:hypothetical protein
MKKAIRQWMGGHDFHDPRNPECASFNGVLSYRGLPVGYCYYSYVTGRHHHVLQRDCDPAVKRFLKSRDVIYIDDIVALIHRSVRQPRPLATVGAKYQVSIYIREMNSLLRQLGAPPAYRSGDDYVRSMTTEERKISDDLTVILYRLQTEKGKIYPYIVYTKNKTDLATIEATPGWRAFGDDFYGTRGAVDYTLFKIGAVDSVSMDITP